ANITVPSNTDLITSSFLPFLSETRLSLRKAQVFLKSCTASDWNGAVNSESLFHSYQPKAIQTHDF
ncbi:MAG: hypothetical protein WCJ40_14820, partial [Planctomycetota bacterium]